MAAAGNLLRVRAAMLVFSHERSLPVLRLMPRTQGFAFFYHAPTQLGDYQ